MKNEMDQRWGLYSLTKNTRIRNCYELLMIDMWVYVQKEGIEFSQIGICFFLHDKQYI